MKGVKLALIQQARWISEESIKGKMQSTNFSGSSVEGGLKGDKVERNPVRRQLSLTEHDKGLI